MKAGIHPDYRLTKYSCACGNEFSINSTHGGDVHIDICPKCHPFFTGKEKLLDSEGRIEKFKKRYTKKKPVSTGKKAKSSQPLKAKESAKKPPQTPLASKPVLKKSKSSTAAEPEIEKEVSTKAAAKEDTEN